MRSYENTRLHSEALMMAAVTIHTLYTVSEVYKDNTNTNITFPTIEG